MDNIRLVDMCKSGDRNAFGLLYETYLPSMRKVVAYYIHNSDTAWDILHDGFIIAFTSIGALSNGAKLEAWLTTIMKNLSLQYLKNESTYVSVPMPDALINGNADATAQEEQRLTFEELNVLIDKLPDGYGKVFRLAVLDGLSHKEIGALLGIAPHSSSSQLSHAKAMLRRMIVQYRIEMGSLSIIGVILLLLWLGMFRDIEENSSTPIISNNTDDKSPSISDPITDGKNNTDCVIPNQTIIYKTASLRNPEHIAEVTEIKDSIRTIQNDSVANDTISVIPKNIIINERFIEQENLSKIRVREKSDWSLSLAYSGNLGQEDLNRYKIPNPGLPNVEYPTEEIEITEKARHHMPLVIGLSLNKTITSRWSIETGIRYSFLRSDFLSESKLMKKETIQRIHYIGVPLKFNYRIFTYSDFTLYGQGGGSLDIPVRDQQSVTEFTPGWTTSTTAKYRVNAPLQWSVEGGLGIQYHFTPSISIYVEPSFHYYFHPGSDIKTIRQDKPFEFTIPIGFGLTW